MKSRLGDRLTKLEARDNSKRPYVLHVPFELRGEAAEQWIAAQGWTWPHVIVPKKPPSTQAWLDRFAPKEGNNAPH